MIEWSFIVAGGYLAIGLVLTVWAIIAAWKDWTLYELPMCLVILIWWLPFVVYLISEWNWEKQTQVESDAFDDAVREIHRDLAEKAKGGV